MAALVQTIPQHSSTVPVLQTRPSSSSSGTFVSSSTQHSGSHYQNMSWSSFNSGNSGSYRAGHPIVAPYAYAPNLGSSASSPTAQHRQSWSPHLRPESRTFSAPAIHQGSLNPSYTGNSRVNNPAAGSVSTSSSSNSSFRSHISKDDSALPSRQLRTEQPLRPLSTANLPPPNVMNISSPVGSAKPSPNRYRRANQQRTDSARSQSPVPASTSPAIDDKTVAGSLPVLRSNGHNRVSSVDDSSHLERPQPELAKRYRRRSLGNMDTSAYPSLELQMPVSSSQSGPYDFIAFDTNQRPRSAHSHRGSSGSVQSAHSSSSSVRQPLNWVEFSQSNQTDMLNFDRYEKGRLPTQVLSPVNLAGRRRSERLNHPLSHNLRLHPSLPRPDRQTPRPLQGRHHRLTRRRPSVWRS